MLPTGKSILLIGYSTRALSHSVYQSGLAPYSIDFFGDRDQHQWANDYGLIRHGCPDYHASIIVNHALTYDPMSLTYTSDLENYPDLLNQLEKHHDLIGNSSDVINCVRNPKWLEKLIKSSTIKFPPMITSPSKKLDSHEPSLYLLKPFRSGGGLNIRRWNGQPFSHDFYIQKHIQGIPLSIQVLSNGEEGHILAITEQLIGNSEFHVSPFQYVGNMLPYVPSTDQQDEQIHILAQTLVNKLVDQSQIRGFFGIDCIWDQQQLWFLEVNPRPTSVIDLLDQIISPPMYSLHHTTCTSEGFPSYAIKDSKFLGKAIVYAQVPCVISNTTNWARLNRHDIPWPNDSFQPHIPICTVSTQSSQYSQILPQLVKSTHEVYKDCNTKGKHPPIH